MATPIISESFSSVTTGTAKQLRGTYALSVSGFGDASVNLERSLDGGSTWHAIKTYTAGAEEVLEAPNSGIQYRFNCIVYTSGTIACVLQG